MNNLITLMNLMFILSWLLISTMYKHLLLTIMSLEMMMFTLMMTLYLIMMMFNLEFFLLYFLLMTVCEGVLSLTLMMLLIKFKGMDKLNLLNLNMW